MYCGVAMPFCCFTLEQKKQCLPVFVFRQTTDDQIAHGACVWHVYTPCHHQHKNTDSERETSVVERAKTVQNKRRRATLRRLGSRSVFALVGLSALVGGCGGGGGDRQSWGEGGVNGVMERTVVGTCSRFGGRVGGWWQVTHHALLPAHGCHAAS